MGFWHLHMYIHLCVPLYTDKTEDGVGGKEGWWDWWASD